MANLQIPSLNKVEDARESSVAKPTVQKFEHAGQLFTERHVNGYSYYVFDIVSDLLKGSTLPIIAVTSPSEVTSYVVGVTDDKV